MKQTFVKEENIDPYEGQYFIAMCLIHLKRSNLFIRFFCEVYSLNEKNIINKFSKIYKQYANDLPKVVSLTKFTYEELYQFDFNEFSKLFPRNLKVFHFKTTNDKIFIKTKLINNADHEFFYLKKMESEGFKCIGQEEYKYRHKLYNK